MQNIIFRPINLSKQIQKVNFVLPKTCRSKGCTQTIRNTIGIIYAYKYFYEIMDHYNSFDVFPCNGKLCTSMIIRLSFLPCNFIVMIVKLYVIIYYLKMKILYSLNKYL